MSAQLQPEPSVDAIQRALTRERAGRRRAEQLLEERSRELYLTNEQLRESFAEIAQEKRELELLHELNNCAPDDAELEEALDAFVRVACKLLGWDYARVVRLPIADGASAAESSCLTCSDVVNACGDVPSGGATWTTVGAALAEQSVTQIGELCQQCWQTRQASWSYEFDASWSPAVVEQLRALDLQARAVVPIIAFGQVAFVLEFYIARSDPVDRRFLDVLELAAQYVGLRSERQARASKIKAQFAELQQVHAELTQAQTAMVHQEKLASLGLLSAGIAHELNNPLAFVSSNARSLASYVQTMRTQLESDAALIERLGAHSEVGAQALESWKDSRLEADLSFIFADSEELLADTEAGLQRVLEIVAGLRSFARVDSEPRVEVDVNECVSRTLTLVRSQLKHHCQVITELKEVPWVMANPGEICQVLTNLLINARQAIESDGTISIQTAHVANEVLIKVSDDGSGIAPETLKEIFTPFFTTKPDGQGTGLGLAISHGLISQCGGAIDVQSEVGEGTTFCVRLPALGGAAAP